MIDIVIPNDNENDFVAMAKHLGISELIFLYKKRPPAKIYDIPTHNAVLAMPQQTKNILSICLGSRDAIERGATIVYDFETIEPKDHTHYRRSGLNQVLCKLAKQKKVTIGFSLATILHANTRERAQLIGRMMQNIAFCEKFGVQTKIASFATTPHEMRSPHDLRSFFITLGMREITAQHALTFRRRP